MAPFIFLGVGVTFVRNAATREKLSTARETHGYSTVVKPNKLLWQDYLKKLCVVDLFNPRKTVVSCKAEASGCDVHIDSIENNANYAEEVVVPGRNKLPEFWPLKYTYPSIWCEHCGANSHTILTPIPIDPSRQTYKQINYKVASYKGIRKTRW